MAFQWQQLQPHAEPESTPEAGQRPCGRDIWGNSFVQGGQLYVFGGAWNRFPPGDRPDLDRLGVGNDLWRFDPAFERWTQVQADDGSLAYHAGVARPGGRLLASLGVVGDNVFMFGGLTFLEHGNIGRALNDLWRYHVPTSQWEQLHPDTGWCNYVNRPSHPPIRIGAASAVLGTKLYVFGGAPFTSPGFTCNDFWCYDAVTGQWEQLSGWRGPGQGAGYAASATYPGPRYVGNLFAHAGYLYLFSGRDLDKTGERDVTLGGTGPEWFNDLWRYNPAANEWALLHPDDGAADFGLDAPYPAARYGSGHTVHAGHFYLFGGYSSLGGGQDRNDFWRYDIAADRWTQLHADDGEADYGPGRTYPPVRRVPVLEAMDDALLLFGGLNYFVGPAERGFWAHPTGGRRRPHPTPLNDLWRCNLGD